MSGGYQSTEYVNDSDKQQLKGSGEEYKVTETQYTVTTQPVTMGEMRIGQLGPPREWSSSLFSCKDDVKVCLCVLCCTPFYQCYKLPDFGENCCNGWPCFLGPVFSFLLLRYRTRALNNIEGSMLKDCIATGCCYCCMACQLLREKKYLDANKMSVTATVGNAQTVTTTTTTVETS